MTRQRVAILPLTQSAEGNRVDPGGVMQLQTRPQRPIRICGVMLVVGFYVGIYSVLISSGPLSANLLVQLGRVDKFQIVSEPVVVGQDVRLNLHNTAATARNVRGALLCEVIS